MPIDDKYDRVKRLMEVGKERGYVLYDEVSDVLPADLNGGGDLDDVLAGFDGAGIEILEDPKPEFDKKLDDGGLKKVDIISKPTFKVGVPHVEAPEWLLEKELRLDHQWRHSDAFGQRPWIVDRHEGRTRHRRALPRIAGRLTAQDEYG